MKGELVLQQQKNKEKKKVEGQSFVAPPGTHTQQQQDTIE